MTERGETGAKASTAMKCMDLGNWGAFEDALKGLRRSPDGDHKFPLLFRGQSKSSWRLRTTLERENRQSMLLADYYQLISVIRSEIEIFTGTQWAIPKYPELEELMKEYDSFSRALTFGQHPAYDYMVFLRHHGFPSPLLDWTRSPRVAAYFAFRNATDSESVAIYVLSESRFKIHSSGVPAIYRLGPYVKTHQRHFLQQSDYTMCLIFGNDKKWRFAEHDNALACDNDGPNANPNFCIQRFTIPASERVRDPD